MTEPPRAELSADYRARMRATPGLDGVLRLLDSPLAVRALGDILERGRWRTKRDPSGPPTRCGLRRTIFAGTLSSLAYQAKLAHVSGERRLAVRQGFEF